MIPMFIPNPTEIDNEIVSQNSHSELQTDGPVNTMEINVRTGTKNIPVCVQATKGYDETKANCFLFSSLKDAEMLTLCTNASSLTPEPRKQPCMRKRKVLTKTS